MPVDFHTISGFEGGCRCDGYVPDPEGSRSGVTVATGVDLGQRAEADLRGLGLPDALVGKLRPYLGACGPDAVRLLARSPLRLTRDEAERLDHAVKGQAVAGLRAAYDEALAPGLPRFDDLPSGIQTVIASVAFQYGTNLARRTPTFWSLVTRQDWAGALAELEDFGDRYPTRRRREAAILRACLEDA